MKQITTYASHINHRITIDISVHEKQHWLQLTGSDRNVNNVTPTSFIPWHFLIASHTRVNAMHSSATIMRRACINMLLAHICLPTHIPKSQYYSSFWCSTSISRKAGRFTSVFHVRRPFRAKGFKSWKKEPTFCLSFWRSTSISCERVAIGTSKSQFTSVFDVPRPFRAKGLRLAPQNRNLLRKKEEREGDIQWEREEICRQVQM